MALVFGSTTLAMSTCRRRALPFAPLVLYILTFLALRWVNCFSLPTSNLRFLRASLSLPPEGFLLGLPCQMAIYNLWRWESGRGIKTLCGSSNKLCLAQFSLDSVPDRDAGVVSVPGGSGVHESGVHRKDSPS